MSSDPQKPWLIAALEAVLKLYIWQWWTLICGLTLKNDFDTNFSCSPPISLRPAQIPQPRMFSTISARCVFIVPFQPFDKGWGSREKSAFQRVRELCRPGTCHCRLRKVSFGEGGMKAWVYGELMNRNLVLSGIILLSYSFLGELSLVFSLLSILCPLYFNVEDTFFSPYSFLSGVSLPSSYRKWTTYII